MRTVLRGLLILATLLLCSFPHPAFAADNLIVNGDFDTNLASWSFWFAPGQAVGSAAWIARDGGGAVNVEVVSKEGPSSVQVFQGPFSLTAGEWYEVSFEVRADTPTNLRLGLLEHSSPYGGLGLSTSAAVTNQWQSVSVLARATKTTDNARLDFYPDVSVQLDSIRVIPIGAEPPQLSPDSIVLSPGWQGDGATLLDGNVDNFIASVRHTDLPLLVTLDFGSPQAIAGVTVHGQDRGVFSVLRTIRAEFSQDGVAWRAWGNSAKTSGTPDGTVTPVQFTAQGVAVPARYVRVRIAAMTNQAFFSEIEVFGAGAAGQSSFDGLPQVPSVTNLAFQGWDYEAIGFDASPGEATALRFMNQDTIPIATTVNWRLETYDGAFLDDGQTALSVAVGESAEAPFALPAGLEDGMARLRFTLGAEGEPQAFAFDYRIAQSHADLGLNLVALLDNVDPEGWVRMMAGPASPYMDIRRSIPAIASEADAVLAASEDWAADSPQVQALDAYLQAGGVAIAFGKLSPGLEALAPVDVNEADPWIDTPRRLQAPSFWPEFNPANGPRQYGVRATAKAGSTVLATWDDGTPAVVEGAVGAGRMIFIGAGPGRLWQDRPGLEGADELALRAVYYALGRAAAPSALTSLAQANAGSRAALRDAAAAQFTTTIPADARVGLSHGNSGRFAWLSTEGGLVESVAEEAIVSSPGNADPYQIVIPGRGPLTPQTAQMNWLAKDLEWHDDTGVALRSTISAASACILWEGDAQQVEIALSAGRLFYAASGGVQSIQPGDTIQGADLAHGWLIAVQDESDVRDRPIFLFLRRQPNQIDFTAEGLALDFPAGGFDALWTGRLYGLRRLGLGETAGWAASFPAAAKTQAELLARLNLAYPVGCDEMHWADQDGQWIADRFTFRSFTSDWGIAPLELAPLPPVASLAKMNGHAIQVTGALLAVAPTNCGPLEGVAGSEIIYHLPTPPSEHFGIIPSTDHTELNTLIDQYAIDGMTSAASVTGGLTSPDAFIADMQGYIDGSSPYDSARMDLYKWLYCFPTLLARPVYGTAARTAVDAYNREHYWRTINYYPYKSIVRWRREPWTGLEYMLTFVWPVHFKDGVRFFLDENESAALLPYCLEAYSHYYGDWDTAASNWNLYRYLWNYLQYQNDWAIMASSNQEYYDVAGIDMLNAEFPGNLAMARMAERLGDKETASAARYMAARTAIAAVARLYMPDYMDSITATGDPWRDYVAFLRFKENGIDGETEFVNSSDPNAIAIIANGMLDTSKGTSPEIALLYKTLEAPGMQAYEQGIKNWQDAHSFPAGPPHLMMRAFLGWDRAALVAAAQQQDAQVPLGGWNKLRAPGNWAILSVDDLAMRLIDWTPAEYVDGQFSPASRLIELVFDLHDASEAEISMQVPAQPRSIQDNSYPHGDWTYEPASGNLSITLSGAGAHALDIQLFEEADARLWNEYH